MAWTTPRTWVAAEVATAANLNTHVRDNLSWLGTRKGFKIRRVATQSITTSTVTAISFDTEDSDTDAFGTVTGTTYTIPTGLDGLYAITAVASLSGGGGTNPIIRIITAGVSFDYPISAASNIGSGCVVLPLVATNTIALSVFQNSGGSLNATATLWANFVGR